MVKSPSSCISLASRRKPNRRRPSALADRGRVERIGFGVGTADTVNIARVAIFIREHIRSISFRCATLGEGVYARRLALEGAPPAAGCLQDTCVVKRGLAGAIRWVFPNGTETCVPRCCRSTAVHVDTEPLCLASQNVNNALMGRTVFINPALDDLNALEGVRRDEDRYLDRAAH